MSSRELLWDWRSTMALALAFSFVIGQGQASADVSQGQKFDSKSAATETELSSSVEEELEKIADAPFDFCSVEALKAHTLATTRVATARTQQALKNGRRPDVQVRQDIAELARQGVDDGAINDPLPVVDEFVDAKKRGDVSAVEELLQKMTPLQLARAAMEQHDWAQAINVLTPVADAGDADAQTWLGFLYSAGGRPLAKLAEQERPSLPAKMVTLLCQTSCTPPENEALAFRYFPLAAAKGNADAQGDLALAYSCGQGTDKDYVRAYAWFSLEMAQRTVTIQTNWAPKDILARRDFIADEMSAEQIKQAKRLLIQCYKSNYKKCE